MAYEGEGEDHSSIPFGDKAVCRSGVSQYLCYDQKHSLHLNTKQTERKFKPRSSPLSLSSCIDMHLYISQSARRKCSTADITATTFFLSLQYLSWRVQNSFARSTPSPTNVRMQQQQLWRRNVLSPSIIIHFHKDFSSRHKFLSCYRNRLLKSKHHG